MIEFQDVTKSFDDEVVLKNISFKVQRGETLIILGESGSGKSTVLKLILGLIKPDSGKILIEGSDITDMTERELVAIRRNIGMVFQEGALFDSLPVSDNVGYRLYEEGAMEEAEVDSEVQQHLGFVGLEEAFEKMPVELSGGMKRRVGIARALVGNPEIILYDEPTAGLDPITKRTIVELMIKLRDMQGVTSIFVTHDLHAASIIATEYAASAEDGNIDYKSDSGSGLPSSINFIMLMDGGICFHGGYRELKASEVPYVKLFVN
ncbi:MAG: ATP-binding cassette domain-containing protein [Acidobacteria bacterium]|nr:ATP-binding cassette domain-containing protein [Acidobacteriota bacterium]